jgi:ATPase subunit of ABC transporter with duplicated ATPase domains
VAGDLDATDGTVSIPKRLRLGVLRQDQFLYEDEEILAVTLMGNRGLWDAMVEKEKILANAESHFDADRFSELEELVQQLDGYTAESRAAAILEGLGIPAEIHRNPLSTLSGGFRLRVLLAQVLASAPDALLLDEPTNHLDILSIRWLETFLRDFSGPVVVISHDHRFLDNVCTRILDVDYQTVLEYHGNYTQFIAAKQAERERRGKEIEAREKEIAHHQKFVDRFRAKASKARQAQSKLRLIEKRAADLGELPQSSRRYPTFRFDVKRDSGREVLRVKGVNKAFGDNEVLNGVDLRVNRGDRLAIIGPNGIGKSTLLKIAVGKLEADAGEVEWGYESHPGYFAQDYREQFDSTTGTAEEWIWHFCPDQEIGFVRSRMAMVLFTGDEGKKRMTALSGGEAARLVFARLSLDRPNVLVLDEPTNHLDLESIEALVDGLKQYSGTLIFVSHDRWFAGQLANRVVEITPGGIRDYPGTYAEYVHACGDDHLDVDTVVLKAKREKRQKKAAGSAAPTSTRPSVGKQKARLRKLQARLEDLTKRIEHAEGRLAEIDALFCEADYYDRTPADEIRGLEAERNDLQATHADLMSQWEDTGEEIEAVESELEAAGVAQR